MRTYEDLPESTAKEYVNFSFHSFIPSDKEAITFAMELQKAPEGSNLLGYFCLSMIVVLPLLTYLGG